MPVAAAAAAPPPPGGAAAPPGLRIFIANANGLSSRSKRQHLFNFLAAHAYDAVVLVETHCSGSDVAAQWLREGAGAGRPWLGEARWAHGSSNARGVGVLFRAGLNLSALTVDYISASGRVLRVGWQDGDSGQKWAVVAAYAPNAGVEQQQFFATGGPLHAALSCGDAAARVLLAGDFNCVLHAADSSAADAPHQAALPAACALRSLLVTFNLSDVWLHQQGGIPSSGRHPGSQCFTYWAPCGTARRLDRIYASASALPLVRACSHLPLGRLPGDHCAVVAELGGAAPRLGTRPLWRFPLGLLCDATFKQRVDAELSAFQQSSGSFWPQHSAASASQRYELLKERLRGVAQTRELERRREQRAHRVALEQHVCAASAAHAAAVGSGAPAPALAAAAAQVRQAASRLRAHSAAAADSDATKCDALWHDYGEQPTFWFHRLGRSQAPAQPMREVRDPASHTVLSVDSLAGAQRGAAVVADYFDGDRPGGMFALRPTDAPSRALMLSALDKELSPTAAAVCEGDQGDGSLSEEELKAALATVPRGAAPGSDGFPYEFYVAFWSAGIGAALQAAVNEAFLSPVAHPQLSVAMRLGIIALLYKGGGAPRDDVASFRPITLLNADYKIVAKAVALRIGAALDSVVDHTQTAFVPGRWIGDNILFHLDLLDLLSPEAAWQQQSSQPQQQRPQQQPGQQQQQQQQQGQQQGQPQPQPQPQPPQPLGQQQQPGRQQQPPQQQHQGLQQPSGCITFLDFLKAYDRIDREWIFAVLETMGFGAGVLRWTRLLLAGTRAVARFGGCLSRPFAVHSGAAQGSPLSPLLFVAAVQPLAARLRHLQANGAIDAIRLPTGRLAPPSHQHADDTTIHTATADGAAAALHLAVDPFCLASASSLNLNKCRGLCLGSHPSISGTHPGSGVEFLAPNATIKHLGILLTTGDRAAAAADMWQRRVGVVASRVQHWRSVDLTLTGRAHVAKQVLVSTLVHAATFVEPPAAQLRALRGLIDGFVAGSFDAAGGEDPGGSAGPSSAERPLRARPSAAAATLPKAEGGMAAADIALHGMALRAKVAACLLHPQRRPWKELAAAALNAAAPGLGTAALVTCIRPGARLEAPLPPRVVSYWRALAATQPHRLVQPSDMVAQQVGLEPLAGNSRVAPRAGAATRVPWGQARTTWGVAARVRDLRPAASGQLPAALPAAWQAMLAGPQPPTDWEASDDGAWVRFSKPGQQRLFSVAEDGRLLDPPTGAAAAAAAVVAWHDCCVAKCPLLRGRPAGAEDPLPPASPQEAAAAAAASSSQAATRVKMDLYLVGTWAAAAVDPSLWGHAGVPLTSFAVRAACERMLQLRASKAFGSSYAAGVAIAPPLWGPPGPGPPDAAEVARLAQRQLSAYRVKLRLTRRNVQRRRVPDSELMSIYHASWMEASSERQLPAARAAAQQAAAAAHAQLAAAAAAPDAAGSDDCADPLQLQALQRPAWRAVWGRAGAKGLPRELRVFAWLLLHAALPCGAAKVVFFPADGEDLAGMACCRNAACRPPPPAALPASQPGRRRGRVTDADSAGADAWQLETLQHALLDCPAVRPALQWLAALWPRFGGTAPPLSPEVWLQDSPAAWQPQGGQWAVELWGLLRLAVLWAAWELRCRRLATGQQFAAADVVDAVVDRVERLVRADWQRVGSDLREVAGTSPSWFPHRGAPPSEGEFEERWCAGGVIAALVPVANARPRLVVRFGSCRLARGNVGGAARSGAGGAGGAGSS